jgi:hypothetical protein
MKKSRMNWTVKRFMKEQSTGNVQFSYPIQRAGEQWDKLQKSLLIHSIVADFPVPALYVITEEVDKKTIFQVLDGKQRLTNIRDFMTGEYFLHEETPSVMIDGKKEILAGMTFDELSEDAQDAIKDFTLDLFKIEEATDEEIEDMFYRLNNGTPLSKQQKAKAKMGRDWANKIQDLVNHDLVKNKASFTPLQMRKADHETALLQTMMLIDENHELKSIASNDVFEYSQTFKEDAENKEAIVKKLVDVMDYIDNSFESKEPVLLKKVHFPMTILTAMKAKENKISEYKFGDWRTEFKKSLKASDEDIQAGAVIPTDYKLFGGAGSVKKEKTLGRVKSMQEHLDKYVSKNKVATSPVKPVEEPKAVVNTQPSKDDKKPVEAKKEEPKAQVKVDDKRKATNEKKETSAKPAGTGKAQQVKKESSKEKSTTA